MIRPISFLTLILFASTARPHDELAGFSETMQPFLKKYCLRCHGAKKQEGRFRLDTLSRDFGTESIAGQWDEVMFRINSGEMPPDDELQPSAPAVGDVAEWISARITEGRAARMARRGPVAHYRLSRDEYAYAVYDLLGVYFDARMPGALNEDPRWHGFDRIGSMLSLAPSHVDLYFKVAQTVLNQAFPAQEPKTTKGRSDSDRGRWFIFPGQRQGNISVRHPGLYRIRIQLSAIPSFKGRIPRISIWNSNLKRSEIGREVIAPEDKPTVVEIEAFLPQGGFQLTNESPGKLDDGHTLSFTPRTVTSLKTYKTTRPTGYKFFTGDGQSIFPLLLVDWVEHEGPVLTEKDENKRHGLFPDTDGDVVQARACLARLISRAWRRPPTQAEINRCMKVFESEIAAGETFRTAYLGAMTAVLTSKNFYYLVEGTPGQQRQHINDWELASRLSFFLWSSIPDEDLFVAAREGTLHNPEMLRPQLKRMLADPKIARFTNSFPQQWLQLHKVGMFSPDPELYPDYDLWLEKSMVHESTRFFNEVFSRNLSIRDFLISDWTMINSRLALHYGLPRVRKSGFQRVALKPADHRGGLLTQAAVLSLTSDGTRHRPVHRGVWVSEAIFGKTPPPPPPNVEPLEPAPSDKPKATIRQQLEAHATHITCASCHHKIDPLGFAFDNYDAVGRWRTEEHIIGGQGDNPAINAGGTLPDGRSYKNPAEFKQLLSQDIDRFAEAFIEQLATFALRRVMTTDDTAQIKVIAQAGKQDNYRLRTLLENFVMSDLFQKR